MNRAPRVSTNRNGVRLITVHESRIAVDLLSALDPDPPSTIVVAGKYDPNEDPYPGAPATRPGGNRRRKPAWQRDGFYDASHLEQSPDKFKPSYVESGIVERTSKTNLHVPVEIYGPCCQHPQTRKYGVCGRQSIGVFEVPDDYIPPRRHSNNPLIPRPHARLCRQHYSIVSSWARGARLAGNSHESWCAICQHPARNQVIDLWLQWRITVDQAVLELGVTHRAWYNHINYFKLNSAKTSKENILSALVTAAERGLSSGGDDVKSGMKAVELITRHSDWVAPKNVKVDVSGKLEVSATTTDFSRMTDAELADHFEGIARQIRQAGGVVRQLPGTGQVIDLPDTSVRELVPIEQASTDSEDQ
jgi:hypothetical protein